MFIYLFILHCFINLFVEFHHDHKEYLPPHMVAFELSNICMIRYILVKCKLFAVDLFKQKNFPIYILYIYILVDLYVFYYRQNSSVLLQNIFSGQ